MSTHPSPIEPPVLLLATGAGLGAASLYYAQPLLSGLAVSLHVSPARMGLVPTVTQVGYALGILFLAPLGDRFDRRQVLLSKAAMLVAALVMTAFAASFPVLLVSSFAVGVAATLAQDIVPAAATMAQPAQRGRVVGTVMTGLLLGILLARVASGFVGERFSFRAVYLIAASAVAVVGVALARGLPRFAPTTTLPYGALLVSLVSLARRHAGVRRAMLAQGLLSLGFSAFWSLLAIMLAETFGLGSTVAGAFGLAGAAGALVAPLAGRFADRHGPSAVTRAGALISALSFAAMSLEGALPRTEALALLVLTTVTFDLGVQASVVGHQTRIYALEPEARSRLNALFLSAMFFGMAAGAALGSALYARFGWSAVTVLGAVAGLGALAVDRLTTESHADRAEAHALCEIAERR